MPRVAFTDLGWIAQHALACLSESLDEERGKDFLCILLDGRPVRPVDVERGPLWQPDDRQPFWRPDDVGKPRNQVLAERFNTTAQGFRVEARNGMDQDRDAGRNLRVQGCDLVVLSAEIVDPSSLWRQHRGFFGQGLAILPAFALGDAGWLGPLNHGNVDRDPQGPCLRCAYERVRAATGEDPFESPEMPDPDMCRLLGEALAGHLEAFVMSGEMPPSGTLDFSTADGQVTHPVLRTPHCPHCGDLGPFMPYRYAAPLPMDEEPSIDPETGILDLATRLISPLTGPVVEAEPVSPAPGDPNFEIWSALGVEPGDDGVGRVYAGAVGIDREKAQAATLGEAVERAASRRIRPQDSFLASWNDMADLDAVDPRAWDVTHPETRADPDYPFPAFDADRPLRWIWAHSLEASGAGRPKAVPAAFVPAFRDPEGRIETPVVSGFAAGTHYAEAAWRGFREVVERDAFMILWGNRLPMTGLCLDDSAPSAVQKRKQHFDDVGLKVRASTIQLDLGCHLVVAQCRPETAGNPATVIAAAADPELETAVCRALEEVAAALNYVRSEMRRAGGRLPLPDPMEVRNMGSHGLLYARPEMRAELDPWWEPSEMRQIPEAGVSLGPRERLRRGVEMANAADLEVLVVDLTPPEIHDLGLRVVKTLIPGTYPMQFDSRWPHFGGDRMRQMPVDLGLLPKPLEFFQFRRVPHPFP